MIQYRFSKERSDFYNTLRQRVNDYFAEKKISRNANATMVLKTLMAFCVFLAPFAIILLFGNELNLVAIYALCLVMAFGKAFIGTSVMHDSLHGSFSKKKKINSLVGWCSYLVGANPKMWQIQHNVIHHTYTNVHEVDEDLDSRYVFRFSPHQPKKWFHRYQHIYVWFFYSLSVILWSSVKDFKKLLLYKRNGYITTGKEFNKYFFIITVQKIAYFLVFIGIPMYVLGWSFIQVLGMFVFMEAVTGILLSVVFETAHVMPEKKFLHQKQSLIKENWAEHQLQTTTNYGKKSRILCWFTGGLNFQIEHHLFPNICHIHYSGIADIVKQTAKEFGLPYHEFQTFFQAIKAHYNQLKMLGNTD